MLFEKTIVQFKEELFNLNEETQAKQVPTNYSHQIAEKFVMSENKTIYRGRGGQISTPILRGHRAGLLREKIANSKVRANSGVELLTKEDKFQFNRE